MSRPSLSIFYIATAVSITTLGDSLFYTILPSYYPHIGLLPIQVGILLSINRWIRLATNHTAEYCYRRFPSTYWLIFALLMGSMVTAIYGIARLFIILLGARILWGISFSFIRQAALMTVIQSGSEVHRVGQRMGYYRGFDAIWRTSGVFLGGISHDVFGFTFTFVAVSLLALITVPLGVLSQKRLQILQTPLAKAKDIPGKGEPWVICCGFAGSLVSGGMILSTLGFILKEKVGESFGIAGYSIGVATLTGTILGLKWFSEWMSPLWGTIGDRAGRERFITFLFAVGTASLIPITIHPNPILLFIGILMFFICGTTLYTLLVAQAGLAGPRSLASFLTANDLGMSLGPLIGWSIAQWGLPTNFIFITGGVFYSIGMVISFYGPKKHTE